MTIRHVYGLATALLIMGMAAQAQDNLVADKIFSDHMVLQRDIPVPVWGTAKPGTKVTVTFGKQSKATEADKDGKWITRLDAMKFSTEPGELVITAGTDGKPVKISDVLIGDVYLCAGQSNMEWTMAQIRASEDIAKANFPLIRHSRNGRGWSPCASNTAARFSAVGFYFGRKIHEETGIPVGLLNNAIGGTPIEPWIAPEGVDATPALTNRDKKVYSKLYTPHTLPLIPYAIKGMIWYQGESNGKDDDIYMHKMDALIAGWRKAWNQGDFPVYFVQLTTFHGVSENPEGGDGFSKTRMAQFKSLRIKNTGMAVIIDIGDARNIHPGNKLDVGNRLALWALAKDYGKKDLVFSGPLYKGMKIEGEKIRVTFDHVGKGLMVGTKNGTSPAQEVPDGKLKRFAIACVDTAAAAGATPAPLKWFWADAVIDGDTVLVSSPDVKQPVAVHYAYSGNPAGCNLYNKDGLPASPFRTED